MEFTEHDMYVVRSDFVFGLVDEKVLSYLYQPLVGVEAIGLYNAFLNELDHYKLQGCKGKISLLLKILRLPIKKLHECFSKLEAIGLLKTYMKLNDGMRCLVFELHPPLSPESFINNDLLATYLKSELDEAELKVILGLFGRKRFNRQQYTELTHSFDEVFGSFNPEKIVLKNNDLIGDRTEKWTAKTNEIFNVDNFKEMLKKASSILPSESITDELTCVAQNLACAYGYNEEEMANMVEESYVGGNKVDISELRNIVRTSYSLKKGVRGPKIIEREKVEIVNKEELSKMEKVFIETKPHDWFRSYFKGGEPPEIDLKVLEEILLDLKLKPEVLNVLIDYIMYTNDHKFYKGPVLKIASEWKRLGIETVQQAMKKAKLEIKNRQEIQEKQKVNVQREKGEGKPKWVKGEKQESRLTEEELAKREEALRRLLNED